MRYLAVLIFSLVFLSGCLEDNGSNSTSNFSPEEANTAAYDVALIAGDEAGTAGENATTADGDTNLAPEPATLAMFGLGLGGIVAAARRKKK